MEQMVRTQLETNVLLKLEAKIGQNLNLFRSSMELNWSAEWEMWTKARPPPRPHSQTGHVTLWGYF